VVVASIDDQRQRFFDPVGGPFAAEVIEDQQLGVDCRRNHLPLG
jgi:hypothetical protein